MVPGYRFPGLSIRLQRPVLRDLRPDDVERVQSLLTVLPDLYPGGETWLRHRLNDALAGRARCTLVEVDNTVAGVAIETPKALGRLKLSTFLIADEYRNVGVGGSFIQFLRDRWRSERVDQVHVTVADQHHDQVRRIFEPVGFTTMAHEANRYGPGRNEYVMICLPSGDSWR